MIARCILLVAIFLFEVADAPFDPFAEARIDTHPGSQVPLSVLLMDEHGQQTTLGVLGRGKPMLLVPVLHDCPNLCGVTLDGLASAMRRAHVVADRDAVVVAFGIDPMESVGDAQASLSRLALRAPELAGRVHATVASAAAIHRVTDAIGYHYAFDPRIRQYAHAAAIAVLTPQGRFSHWLYGIAPEPADLTAALADARAGRTGGIVQQLILLCYHYDPETGRYDLAIAWLLRAGGMLIVLALALYLIFQNRGKTGA